MVFGVGCGENCVNDGAFEGGMERCRGGIIKRGTNVYGGMAGGHKVVDRYGRENCVVIAFGMMSESWILRVVKEMTSDGDVEDVLEVKVWGRIREGGVDVDGEMWVVKGVRIGGLYREGHGNWGRRMGKGRGVI
jgi:hypothetical protein